MICGEERADRKSGQADGQTDGAEGAGYKEEAGQAAEFEAEQQQSRGRIQTRSIKSRLVLQASKSICRCTHVPGMVAMSTTDAESGG